MRDDTSDVAGALVPLASERGLVVLAGAGISMAPPTSLPSWRDFNTAVLEALADRLEKSGGGRGWVASRLDVLITRRKTQPAFTPDFMAQIMAEEVGTDYFRVLQALDTNYYNLNHETLAVLAGAGVVRAVITTNFDRLIEGALTACGVPHKVFATVDSFERLAEALDKRTDRSQSSRRMAP